MKIEAPEVFPSTDPKWLRSQLQDSLNLIAAVATTVGEVNLSESFDNPHLRAIAEHFTNIRVRLVNLAADEVPF